MVRRNKNIVSNRQEVSSRQRLRRGQTIVAEREQMISESERMNIRKKAKQKRVNWAIGIIAVGVTVIVCMVIMGQNIYKKIEDGQKEPVKVYTPSVTVEDEGGSELVTARMKEYVGMLEEDF
ncbi:hypothetical protein IJ096_00935, partial [Candidatus Saccharibacteria bacterium]|nr:hypothetical protein [Candidatus Saccharibacteria bacterium]